MPINHSNIPAAYWPGIQQYFGMVYNNHAVEYKALYQQFASKQAFDRDVGVSGFGYAQQKGSGQPIALDTVRQDFTVDYAHIPYGLGFVVTYEELEDNLYAQLAQQRSQSLAISMAKTIEVVSALPYNDAFVGDFYRTGDGEPLCSDQHRNIDGSLYSNKLATPSDLSQAALEDLIIQIGQATDPRGLKIKLMPQSLHVPLTETFNIERIVDSVLQSNSDTNAVNVMRRNRFPGGVHVHHYFNDSSWFIRTDCVAGGKFYWRNPIKFQQDYDAAKTMNTIFAAYMRFSCGYSDPRGVYSSEGA